MEKINIDNILDEEKNKKVNLDNILKEYRTNKKTYEMCASKIKALLEELLRGEKIKVHEVNCRIKEEGSLIKKFETKNGKYAKLEDMTDIIGIRIITYYSDDIDKVAQIVEENLNIDQENSIDKRKVLDIDKFGYLSLHYVAKLNDERLNLPEYRIYEDIKFEIQIRSILQHAWAEIEHDLGYKNNIETPRDIRRNFYRIAGLLEMADKEFIDTREQIIHYEENINKRIKDKEEITFIDKISLEAYVNNDLKYGELISKISKEINVEFYKKEPIGALDLRMLFYMNYETINQIKESIRKNYKKICAIAKEILRGSSEHIPRTAILLYMCYAELAEKNSIEEFKNFFISNNFENDGRDDFELKIMRICKQNN